MATKYLENGAKVSVITHIDRGYLVKNFLINEYDEEYIEDFTYLVDKVYDKPPTQRYYDEIIELHNEIEKLKGEAEDWQAKVERLKEEEYKILHQVRKHNQKKVHINFS